MAIMRITAILVSLLINSCMSYTLYSPLSLQSSGDYRVRIGLNFTAKNGSSVQTKTTTEKSDSDICGITSPSSRIINGTEVDPHQYPWTAAILKTGIHGVFCGASIISRQFILTAAHCIDFEFSKDCAKIRLGAHLINYVKDPEQNSRDFEIDDWKIHEGYNDKFENDIALIKLKTPIDYGNAIRPICLPKKRVQIKPNKPITVVGWGTTEEGDNSKVLLGVELKTCSFKKCQDAYPEEKIEKSMFCAFKPGKDTCNGDSGGPAMMRAKNKQWNIVGVTSWGYGCATSYPGVYTRVSYFIDWIEKNMKNMN